MELGVSMFGDIGTDNNGRLLPAHKRLQELIEEIKLADEMGLDFFGIGEHHRPDYAVSVPEIVLASAATVTKSIRLGSAVSVLSSSDPVKLYQSFATIDCISGGRAELVTGRGSFTESFPLFGYDLNNYNELFEEKLDLLLQINNTNPINWHGKFRAALNNQEVLPRAVFNGLDIWIAVGGTPESVNRAAKYNLPVIFAIIGGSPAQFKPLFDYYRKLSLYYNKENARPKAGVHMHAFFGEDGTNTADAYYSYYARQMNRIGRQRGWPPYTRGQFDYGRGPEGALIIGDANQAIDKILYLYEVLGFTRFAAHMDVGAPVHKDLMKSIEIFGSKIAPKIREALRQ